MVLPQIKEKLAGKNLSGQKSERIQSGGIADGKRRLHSFEKEKEE